VISIVADGLSTARDPWLLHINSPPSNRQRAGRSSECSKDRVSQCGWLLQVREAAKLGAVVFANRQTRIDRRGIRLLRGCITLVKTAWPREVAGRWQRRQGVGFRREHRV
jgi:hypothetical protein